MFMLIRISLLLAVISLSACSFLSSKPKPNTPSTSHTLPNSHTPTSLGTNGWNNTTANGDTGDVWQRMRQGFAFPAAPKAIMQADLTFYGRYPSFMEGTSQRSSRFLYYIVEQLEQRKMPMEIALIPVIESAYNPKAQSPGGAAGLWQIMGQTGTTMGLKRNAAYDGRHDAIASTDAALQYLQRLNKRFAGDWQLTLAAYNLGEKAIEVAIQRNKAKGLPTDFWSLPLPSHTKGYIPKIMAIRTLIENPQKYNIDLHPIPNRPYFAEIPLQGPISLNAAASHAGIDAADLKALNSGYRQAIADPQFTQHLLVPMASANTLASALNNSALRSQLAPAPNALQIAQATIKADKPNTKTTKSTPAKMQAIAAPASTPKGEKITHTVKKGDSLWTLATQYKVKPADIAQWNNIRLNTTVKPGNALIIFRRN